MADTSSPLNEGHLQQLQNALEAVKAAKDQIAKAKRVGIDVTDLENTNNANEAKLRDIKQVYFPGR